MNAVMRVFSASRVRHAIWSLLVVAVSVAGAGGSSALAVTVGFWRLDDAAAGNPVTTAASTVNNALLQGTGGGSSPPVFVADVPGATILDAIGGTLVGANATSVQFGGSNYIDVPFDNLLQPAEFTIEFFMKAGAQGTYPGIVQKPKAAGGTAVGPGNVTWGVGKNNAELAFVRVDSQTTFNRTFTIPGSTADGYWHHFALTYSGGTWHLYRDYGLISTTTGQTTDYDGLSGLRFGGVSPFHPYNDLLDEVRFSSTVLLPDQFLAVPSVTLYWDGGDADGATGAMGGSGTWNTNATANWYPGYGAIDVPWSTPGPNDAFFGGSTGTVTIAAAGVTARSVTFDTDGYTVQGGPLALVGGGVVANQSATVSATITGFSGLEKSGSGTLALAGANTYSGGTAISGGSLQIGNGGTTGTLGEGAVTITSPGNLTFNRSNDYAVPNSIGGSGSLTQAGSGKTIFSGGGFSYIGPTSVDQGTLELRNTGYTFNSPITVNAAGTLDLVYTTTGFTSRIDLAGPAVTGTGVININNAGSGVTGAWTTVNRNNTGRYWDFDGVINVNSGVLTRDHNVANTIRGTATVNVAANGVLGARGAGGITIGALNGEGAVSPLWSGTNATTLTLGSGDESGHFSGVIHGAGTSGTDGTLEGGRLSLIKTGSGTQILSGNNTYFGTTAITGGSLQIGNGGTTGTLGAGAVTITSPGNLTFNRSDDYAVPNTIGGSGSLTQAGSGKTTLSGNGVTYTGATTVSNGTLVFSDTVNLNTSIENNATVEINATSDDSWRLMNNKTLSGNGTWLKTGDGRATFRNTTVTTTGQFLIQQGTLRNDQNASDWSGSTADVEISAGAILDLYADAVYMNRLAGSGFVQNDFGNSSGYSGSSQYIEKLVVGVADGSSTFEGVIRNNSTNSALGSGVGKGGVQLEKAGAGTQSLSGNNTYRGTTNVTAGTLLVNGTHIGGGMYTVQAAQGGTATLGGTGTIGATVTIGPRGIHAPGTSVGEQTVGDAVWRPDGAFEFEINDATGEAGRAAGGWDLLTITSGQGNLYGLGTLDIRNLTAGSFRIDIVSLDGSTSGALANFIATQPRTWEFVTYETLLGEFNPGLFDLNVGPFVEHNNLAKGYFEIVQTPGGLAIGFVPEPNTLLAALMGLTLLLARRRRWG